MAGKTFHIEFADADGVMHAVAIGEDIVEQAKELLDDPSKYFTENKQSILIPLSSLLQTRARPKGIANAIGLMRQAYRGEIARRSPISVIARHDGFFAVEDGNSTVTIARLAGWEAVPCILKSTDIVP